MQGKDKTRQRNKRPKKTKSMQMKARQGTGKVCQRKGQGKARLSQGNAKIR
jgi:hypothetical protein